MEILSDGRQTQNQNQNGFRSWSLVQNPCFCCCCCPKTGTIFVAVLEMVQSLTLPSLALYLYYEFLVPMSEGKTMVSVLIGEELEEFGDIGLGSLGFGGSKTGGEDLVEMDKHKEDPVSKIFIVAGIVLFIIRLLIAISLLFGVFRRVALFIKLWLITRAGLFLSFIVLEVCVIFELKNSALTQEGRPGHLLLYLYLGSEVIFLAICMYSLLTVYAHFLEVRSLSAGSRFTTSSRPRSPCNFSSPFPSPLRNSQQVQVQNFYGQNEKGGDVEDTTQF